MIKIISLLLLLIFILFLFTQIKIVLNYGCVGLCIFAILLFLLGMALIYITEKLVSHFLVWLG